MQRALLIGLGLLGLSACSDAPTPTVAAPDQPAAASKIEPRTEGLGAFAHVTVGVADLDESLALWRDIFGLEIIAERRGADTALAALWDLPADGIARQALLRTPGISLGGIHFIEFTNPGAPVREGAEVFDRVPKNLDLYTSDLPARYEALKARGMQFRAPWVEMPSADGSRFREVQMPGPDATNIVLLEIIGSEFQYSPTGFAGIGPLIIVVDDADFEALFFTRVLGLESIMQDMLSGPEIEQMVGLPAGAGIDFRVFGDNNDPMGRIEVIEYQQTGGQDRYALAKPPATGTLHVTWQVADLEPLRANLETYGVEVTEHGRLDAIFGSGPMISFYSPGGFRIEVQEISD